MTPARYRTTGTATPWMRVLPLLGLVGLAALLAGGQFVQWRQPPVTHPITGRIIPGIATNAAWMDRDERQREESPDRAVALVDVTPGMTVADVGAGTGYMTVRVARLVGPAGKVYANEIQPALLHVIDAKIRREQLGNVELVQGAEHDARLPAGALDIALLVDVYHELRQPQAMLESIRRSLKPSGRLAVIEYRMEDPTIPIAATHRMSVADLRAEIESAGFTFDRAVEELPRQHIVCFRP